MREPVRRHIRPMLIALTLALGLAGCESLDSWHEFEIFGTKKKPIQGERRAVFPEGIPGVQYNAPPAQPTNSNVPIDTTAAPAEQTPAAGPAAAPPSRAVARTKGRSDDPWSGAR
jgi:hypothetical protein